MAATTDRAGTWRLLAVGSGLVALMGVAVSVEYLLTGESAIIAGVFAALGVFWAGMAWHLWRLGTPR